MLPLLSSDVFHDVTILGQVPKMFVFIIVHLSEEYLWALFQLISTGMGRFLNIFHLNFISLRNIQTLCLHCKCILIVCSPAY